MNIADKIRQAARKSGLSVYMVAKLSGVPISMTQKFMAGGGLHCETAERFATGLGYKIVLEAVKGKAVKR